MGWFCSSRLLSNRLALKQQSTQQCHSISANKGTKAVFQAEPALREDSSCWMGGIQFGHAAALCTAKGTPAATLETGILDEHKWHPCTNLTQPGTFPCADTLLNKLGLCPSPIHSLQMCQNDIGKLSFWGFLPKDGQRRSASNQTAAPFDTPTKFAKEQFSSKIRLHLCSGTAPPTGWRKNGTCLQA